MRTRPIRALCPAHPQSLNQLTMNDLAEPENLRKNFNLGSAKPPIPALRPVIPPARRDAPSPLPTVLWKHRPHPPADAVVPENRHLRPGVHAANPGVGRVVPRHDAMAPWRDAAVPGIGLILRVILRATHRVGRRVSRHDLTVPWSHAMVPRLGGGSKEPRYVSRGWADGSVAPHPESWGWPHGSTRSAPGLGSGLKKNAQAAMNPRIHRTNPVIGRPTPELRLRSQERTLNPQVGAVIGKGARASEPAAGRRRKGGGKDVRRRECVGVLRPRG